MEGRGGGSGWIGEGFALGSLETICRNVIVSLSTKLNYCHFNLICVNSF